MPFRQPLLACVLAVCSVAAMAQAYPNRPLRMIVAYSPGGPADAGARVLANGLSTLLKQPVVVDNRAGAAGRIGTEVAAHAAPDGYTMILGTADQFTLNPHVFSNQTINVKTAFEPIAPFARIPLVLAVKKDFGDVTAASVIAKAKANPGKLSYGTWGVGGLGHIAGIMLEQIGRIELLHVPFAGGGPAQLQLLAGQLDMAITGLQFAVDQQKAGAIKVVGLTSASRSPLAPDMPTLSEIGFAGYAVEQWSGLFVPAGTPAAVRNRLEQALREFMATPAAQADVKSVGLEPLSGGPKDLADVLRTDDEKWGKLVRERKISAQ